MNKFLKVLESIFVGIFALLGAICISPLIIIYLLIKLPVLVISDIWSK